MSNKTKKKTVNVKKITWKKLTVSLFNGAVKQRYLVTQIGDVEFRYCKHSGNLFWSTKNKLNLITAGFKKSENMILKNVAAIKKAKNIKQVNEIFFGPLPKDHHHT